jgi:hypothetical protein
LFSTSASPKKKPPGVSMSAAIGTSAKCGHVWTREWWSSKHMGIW